MGCAMGVDPHYLHFLINPYEPRQRLESSTKEIETCARGFTIGTVARSAKNSAWNEVFAIILLFAGTLLFFALISYSPRDLPSWVPWSYLSPPNRPPQNFIGPFGAIFASVFYLLIGAASYFLAAVLLGFGAAKLFYPRLRVIARLPWIVLFIVSGACLLQLQTRYFFDWKKLNIQGPGGSIGYFFGKKLLLTAMGDVGSMILLAGIYLSALILMTGLRPIHLVRETVGGIRNAINSFRDWRLRREMRRADIKGQLAISERELAKQRRSIEKQLKKRGAPLPERMLISPEELAGRPKPRVVDTTALPEEALMSPRRKPSLAELRPAKSKPSIAVAEARRFDAENYVLPSIDLLDEHDPEGRGGADTVGIEIANTRKIKVTLRELMQSADWEEAKKRCKLPLALGKDVYGNVIIADLAQMPHLLIAGTTGSGKSVCINALIASILFRFTPEELRFIMIDPKVVEMQIYEKLPHLAFPVVTDPKKVLIALRWLSEEIDRRYKIFARVGMRNITSFNARPPKKTQKELDDAAAAGVADAGPRSASAATGIRVPREGELIIPDKLPYIVLIIDELADLMQTAPADVESSIARMAAIARAAGIHLIVATQTPRADVITGVIKANIPSRIAFQVASKIDSRVILDENGADRLLGQGDMLYLPPSTSRLIRAPGVLVTDEEIRELVEFVSGQGAPAFDTGMQEKLQSGAAAEEDVTEEDEELVEKCLEIIRQEKRASTSLLQRRLRLGYTRAARIVDILEQRGILGPGEGAKPREILVDLDAAV